jgi:hypothetical protein
MSFRGPTNKFFYDRAHDVYLYYLNLEACIYSEALSDFIYTASGNIKMEGGWTSAAKKMTTVFGRPFTSGQLKARFERLMAMEESELNTLFEEAVQLGDNINLFQEVMQS